MCHCQYFLKKIKNRDLELAQQDLSPIDKSKSRQKMTESYENSPETIKYSSPNKKEDYNKNVPNDDKNDINPEDMRLFTGLQSSKNLTNNDIGAIDDELEELQLKS